MGAYSRGGPFSRGGGGGGGNANNLNPAKIIGLIDHTSPLQTYGNNSIFASRRFQIYSTDLPIILLVLTLTTLF